MESAEAREVDSIAQLFLSAQRDDFNMVPPRKGKAHVSDSSVSPIWVVNNNRFAVLVDRISTQDSGDYSRMDTDQKMDVCLRNSVEITDNNRENLDKMEVVLPQENL